MWCISTWFLILNDGDGLLDPDCIPFKTPFLVCRTVEARMLASENYMNILKEDIFLMDLAQKNLVDIT